VKTSRLLTHSNANDEPLLTILGRRAWRTRMNDESNHDVTQQGRTVFFLCELEILETFETVYGLKFLVTLPRATLVSSPMLLLQQTCFEPGSARGVTTILLLLLFRWFKI
jgi:hypothetical protein